MSLPATQSALWVDVPGPDATIVLKDGVPIPTPAAHEVLVKIECSGICHSDVYNMTGAHPMDVHVAGHEGVGAVVQRGGAVTAITLGQRVGIKWILEACRTCAICARDITLCPMQHNPGRDRPGTLQQYVVAPADHVTPVPDGLSSEEAAPLLCAGLTLYSAIGKTQTEPGDWLVLVGAGGGLGHLGIQLGILKGLNIIAIDSEDKREFCMSQGAAHFFRHDDTDLQSALQARTGGLGAHAVICCVGATAAYNQAVQLLRRGGTLVCVGLPPDKGYKLPLGPMELVVRGLHVVGSSVGTEEQMRELFQLAVAGKVHSSIEVLPWRQFQIAIDMLKASQVKGRIVLRID